MLTLKQIVAHCNMLNVFDFLDFSNTYLTNSTLRTIVAVQISVRARNTRKVKLLEDKITFNGLTKYDLLSY